MNMQVQFVEEIEITELPVFELPEVTLETGMMFVEAIEALDVALPLPEVHELYFAVAA